MWWTPEKCLIFVTGIALGYFAGVFGLMYSQWMDKRALREGK